MKKWSVVIIERYAEDVKVYEADSEEHAKALCENLWKKDMETEKAEAAFPVDEEKSYCDDGYGRLYYKGQDEAIVYTIAEVEKAKE